MTKYLTDERFIVHSNTKEAQDNYRANYDRIFGEKPAPFAAMPGATGGSGYTADEAVDSDAIEIRVRTPQWFYDRLHIGWLCPCCLPTGEKETRRICMIDFEALVFECEYTHNADPIRHKFTDIPRDAK